MTNDPAIDKDLDNDEAHYVLNECVKALHERLQALEERVESLPTPDKTYIQLRGGEEYIDLMRLVSTLHDRMCRIEEKML